MHFPCYCVTHAATLGVFPEIVQIEALTMTNKNLGLLGAGLTIFGVFCPIVTAPFLGGQNYFQNGNGDGTVVLLLGGVACFFILTNRFKALFVAGALSLGVSLFTFTMLIYHLHSVKTSMETDLKDNPFAGLAEMAVQSVQIQWGWLLLLGGAACMIFAAWREIHLVVTVKNIHVRVPRWVWVTSSAAVLLVAAFAAVLFLLWHVHSRALLGHTASVSSVTFSPDGRTLASGSGGYGDNTIKLWDVASGKMLRSLEGQSNVLSLAYSPDGRTLASGSIGNTIKLWDVASGKMLRSLEGQSNVLSLAYSPDGRTLASGSMDSTIKLWDVSSGNMLTTLNHKGFNHVVYSPDGQTLASGSDDHTVTIWDVATGKMSHTLDGHNNTVESVAFSPDGRTLASGSDDETIRLWDVANSNMVRTLPSRHGFVNSVSFSPDGRTLASGGHDHTITIWDVPSGKVLRTLQGHTDSVGSVAFSPDGRTLASGSDDHTIRLWDVAGIR